MMKIGELAREAGVDVQTVRYYEREALLEAPARTASGYRTYGPRHLERLNFIRHCRSLDMPLADVKRLLELSRRLM
jgi:DNA-binding transcriptional MerR regulator